MRYFVSQPRPHINKISLNLLLITSESVVTEPFETFINFYFSVSINNTLDKFPFHFGIRFIFNQQVRIMFLLRCFK